MVRMRDLYYDRGRPMIEVADAFGVPVSTFLRWIAEMGWPRRTSSGPGGARAVMDHGPSPGTPAQSQAGVGGLSTRPSPQGSGEAPHPVASRQGRLVDIPLPSGGERETRGPTTDDEAFAIEVAVTARRELRALGDLSGPVDKNLTLGERERRAAVDRAARPRVRTAHAAQGAQAAHQTSRGRTGSRAQRGYPCDGDGHGQSDAVPVRRAKAETESKATGEADALYAAGLLSGTQKGVASPRRLSGQSSDLR